VAVATSTPMIWSTSDRLAVDQDLGDDLVHDDMAIRRSLKAPLPTASQYHGS